MTGINDHRWSMNPSPRVWWDTNLDIRSPPTRVAGGLRNGDRRATARDHRSSMADDPQPEGLVGHKPRYTFTPNPCGRRVGERGSPSNSSGSSIIDGRCTPSPRVWWDTNLDIRLPPTREAGGLGKGDHRSTDRDHRSSMADNPQPEGLVGHEPRER